MNCLYDFSIYYAHTCIHYRLKKKFAIIKKNAFEISILCSTRLNLSDQKYSKIVKYSCNLK